ncbi:MAG: hypothetical protein QOI09_1624, partial [Chloroflexota bacterium]|nr:hypothetical protein [Chloroflexota bacterium]
MGMLGLQTPLGPPFALPRARLRRLRPPAWLAFLVGGLGLAVGAAVIGDQKAVQPAQSALGVVATAGMLIGIRMHRPARQLPWHLLAACTALTTFGVVFISVAGALGVLGQVLTGAGSLAGFAGFVMLIRGRIPGGDRAALLDAAILASGTSVLIWALGLAPYVLAAGQTSVVATAFFYPTMVASAMVARMWFLPGAHRPATRLIVLLVVASNAIIVLDVLGGASGSGAFMRPMLFASFAELAFMGAAALHPTMAIVPERQGVDRQPVSRRRIIALTLGLLVNPIVLAIDASDGQKVDAVPYVIGGVLIGLLVIGRLGDALRELGESLQERESLMDMLRHQALHDDLTSLPNRKLFTDRLTADLANRSTGRLLSVLLVDLDDFKAVNDSYGHEAGDELLVAVGQRLRAAIREGDIAARFGGDEFLIALSEYVDPRVPVGVAQRILATLGEPFDLVGHRVTVSASVGVAVADAGDPTSDDLVRDADVAMYVAKTRGKGRYEVFEPSMESVATTQLRFREDLAAAIPAGDLRLHYQPVVDLRTGRTIGYEALVRWERDGQLVMPDDFIPMAESSGLIGPLTDWVLDEACRATAGWGRPGDRPWVSVNMSCSQFLRQDIVAHLRRTLKASGLEPSRLVLEITESTLLEIDVARPAIERLSEIGVRLAIDDFGVGYSA